MPVTTLTDMTTRVTVTEMTTLVTDIIHDACIPTAAAG